MAIPSTKNKRNGKGSWTKEAVTPTADTKMAGSGALLQIDHPVENEQIVPGHYAIRISSQREGFVEISINNGDWIPCRDSVGFFWYDWWPVSPGKYEISARVKPKKGKVKDSSVRTCFILGGGSN